MANLTVEQTLYNQLERRDRHPSIDVFGIHPELDTPLSMCSEFTPN